MRQEKRKRKVKVNFKPLEILLSAHARTLQANASVYASESEGREVYEV